jgi:hypothetical protein
MKLMELLTEEQQHLITEVYTVSDQDAVRLSIIIESYQQSLEQYHIAVREYSENSRQAQSAKTKLEQYTGLYNRFVTEMDRYHVGEK